MVVYFPPSQWDTQPYLSSHYLSQEDRVSKQGIQKKNSVLMVIRSWQLEVADDKKDHHHLCTLAFIMPEKSKINHFHLYADRLGVELQQVTNKADCKPYLLILLILICKSLIVSLPSRIGTDIFSSFFLTRKQNYFYISSHFSFPMSLLLPFNKKQ